MKRALAVILFGASALPAQAGESGASHLWIPDAVWLPLNLAVFLFLLYRLVGRPLGRFLESRREGIALELEDSRRKLAEAEELRSQVEHRLAEVEHELAELRDRAELDGRAEAERIAEQAEGEADRFLRRVDEEIARKQTETRGLLVREAAALATDLARDILAREIGDADRKRVLERSLGALRALSKRS